MKKHNSEGFTLLEVLIALAIFSIGILGVAKLQITSTTGNASSRGWTEAASFGQLQLEELMALSLTSLPSTNSLLMDNGGGAGTAGLDDTGVNADNSRTFDTVYNVFWNIAEDEPIAGAMKIRLIVQWTSSGFGTKELVFDTVKVTM